MPKFINCFFHPFSQRKFHFPSNKKSKISLHILSESRTKQLLLQSRNAFRRIHRFFV